MVAIDGDVCMLSDHESVKRGIESSLAGRCKERREAFLGPVGQGGENNGGRHIIVGFARNGWIVQSSETVGSYLELQRFLYTIF